jgi:transglutaminase-like putative cysteine protease
MIFTTTHITTYLYSEPVPICHTQVHLAPRAGPGQRVLSHELHVSPEPAFSTSRTDYFGNEITCFSIHEPHQTLTISAASELDISPEERLAAASTPPWEQVRDQALARSEEAGADEESFRATEFLFRSPFVKIGLEFAAYAEPSFQPGRPIVEAGFDLCHRIFTEFRYDPRATTISTPVDEVLKSRVGVCQDFAHLMISCLRSLRLPARYVSGYLRSGENTHGAEASHAWCAVFCPGLGWLEFDPTNDVIPQGNHATLAWGRDYSDVAPVKGVAVGGGDQLINVSVQVVPQPAAS